MLFGFQSDTLYIAETINALILKIDKNGNYQYHFNFDFGNGTQFYHAKTKDHGQTFDIIGFADTSSTNTSNLMAFLVRIDSAGNELMRFEGRDFGRLDRFNDFEYLPNGNIIINGGKIDSTGSFSDNYLVLIDSNFNILWEYFNPIGIGNVIGTRESLVLTNNGYVFCGWEYNNDDSVRAKVTKIDFQGNILWEYI